ncbi:MAG TPA: AarF/UbiB family protein [Pyrinomonadaceae bacterium]|jgi:ubiquinone biosynthesis protein
MVAVPLKSSTEMATGSQAVNREAGNSLSPILRSFEILLLAARYGAGFSVRVAYLWLRRRRDQYAQTLGESLATFCEALGPAFIKSGQILSARPDLLPAGVGTPLRRLQNRIAPFDGARAAKIVEAAFERPLDDLFESFDLEPVASASIAQVHRARLKDGREVAVKVRRPGVSRVVTNDMRILRFIAKALSSLPGMKAVPLPELVDEFVAPIKQQLDFHLEAANNRRFREQFAHTEHIRLPALVENLCTENVLTMEYLDRLQRTDLNSLSAAERKTAALAGLRALYKMIFLDGFVHADMHPGNVFVREWGEFVILDTGLVAVLDEANQRDFVDFFFGLINNEGRVNARIIYENASYRAKNCDREAFEAEMVKLIARHSALKCHEFEVAQFVYELMEAQRRFKIRGSTKFMMTILSMVVYDGICKQLYPECDFQSEARGFLITARYGKKTAPKDSQRRLDRSMQIPKTAADSHGQSVLIH